MNTNKVFLLVGCLCFSSLLFSQTIGKFDYVEGDVELTRNGTVLSRVSIGMAIEHMDVIATSENGLATISFTPDSGLSGSIQISPKTTALIRKDAIGGVATNEVQLLAGSVNLKVKKLAGSRVNAQVRTPTSVLGVRGTEFVVASFNGSVLVATKEGEVACNPWSMTSGTLSSARLSSVPGTLVEILENGAMKGSDFPKENFEENWKSIKARWSDYQVELIVANPVAMLNMFAGNWNQYAKGLENAAASLQANTALQTWMRQGSDFSFNYGETVKEKMSVMQDLIAVRPQMLMSIIAMYRIEELIPYIPDSAKGQKLITGQTVDSFIKDYTRQLRGVKDAISLFYTAEKLYMLRNDGESPFLDF